MSAQITREGLERLDAALAWIRANPDKHDQASWFTRRQGCGTTCCLAGALSMLAGATPIWDEGESDAYMIRRPGGADQSVEGYAAGLLGVEITSAAVEELFYGASTLADLERIRDQMAASLDGPT